MLDFPRTALRLRGDDNNMQCAHRENRHVLCIYGKLRSVHHRQNSRVAMRAPSAMAANFAKTTSGSTAACPTQVP